MRYWKVITKGTKSLKKGDCIKELATFTEESNQEFSELFKKGGKLSSNYVEQMLVGSLFSKAIGNHLPSSIYISQSFVFKRRVKFGERLLTVVEVIDIN